MTFFKQKRISLGVIIILGLTLYLFGWLKPVLKKYSYINNNLSQIQLQLKEYQILLLNKDEYKKKTLLVKNELKKNRNKLYVGKTPLVSTSEMLGNLERISKETKVNIVTKNILPAKKIDRYYQIFVLLNLQTNPEGLTNFLYTLKTSNRRYSIPYLNILTQKDNKLRVSLVISSVMIEG